MISAVLGASPWFWPTFLVTTAVAGFLTAPVLRGKKGGLWISSLLALSVGAVLAATLTPSLSAGFWGGTRFCGIGAVGIPSMSELVSPNQRSLNVALFVPLGVSVGAVGVLHRWWGALVPAVLAPLLIEVVQWGLPYLGRSCQGADVVDNTFGLVVGMAASFLVLGLWRLAASRASTRER